IISTFGRLCHLRVIYLIHAIARKQAKNDIKVIVKQHEVDLEALERKHQMELEKINLEHTHQLELQAKDFEANLSSSLLTEAMKMPEIRQQISQGIKKGKR
ncbi:MAG: hypothetical protein ACI4TA_10590, partial [Acetatifactor sp.]